MSVQCIFGENVGEIALCFLRTMFFTMESIENHVTAGRLLWQGGMYAAR